MKELSIEQKAQRYDEALSVAKGLYTKDAPDSLRLERMFPELMESDDENIRKWIIDDIRYNMNNETLNNSEYKKKAEKAIAWLEKQGEQIYHKELTDFQEGLRGILIESNGKYDDNTVIRLSGQVLELVEQKPVEWSEEDEYCRHQLIVFCDNCMVPDNSAIRCANWLKSLRPQSQWKPSNEQMEYLAKAIATLGDEGNCKTASILNDLRVELKKLIGE